MEQIWIPIGIALVAAGAIVYRYMRKKGLKVGDLDDEVKRRLAGAVATVGHPTPQTVADGDLAAKLAAAHAIILKQQEVIAGLKANAAPPYPPPPAAAPPYPTGAITL